MTVPQGLVGVRAVVALIAVEVSPFTFWLPGDRVMAGSVMSKVTWLVADPDVEPVAVMSTVAEEFAVGVPENAPVPVLKFRPGGAVPDVDANDTVPPKPVATGAGMEIGQFRRPVTVCTEGSRNVTADTTFCVGVSLSSTQATPGEMSTSKDPSVSAGTKRRYSMVDVLA